MLHILMIIIVPALSPFFRHRTYFLFHGKTVANNANYLGAKLAAMKFYSCYKQDVQGDSSVRVKHDRRELHSFVCANFGSRGINSVKVGDSLVNPAGISVY